MGSMFMKFPLGTNLRMGCITFPRAPNVAWAKQANYIYPCRLHLGLTFFSYKLVFNRFFPTFFTGRTNVTTEQPEHEAGVVV